MTAMKTIRNMMKKMGKGSVALLLAVLFVLLAGIVCSAGAEEKPEMASVNVKVVWDDDNNAAGKRPNYIYMYPSIDDKGTSSGDGSKRLYDSNNWSMTFTSTTIPAFDPETGEKNVFIPAMSQQYHPYGYTVSSTYDEATNTYTYTFTYQQFCDVKAVVWFDDFDNAYGRRPGFDAFNIRLYGKFDANGAVKYTYKQPDESIMNADGTMTLIWHDMYSDYYRDCSISVISSDPQYTASSDYLESSFCNGVKLKLKTKNFNYSSSFYPFLDDKNKAKEIGLPIPERIVARLVDGEGNVVTDLNGTEFDYSYDVFPLKSSSTQQRYQSYSETYSLPLLDEDGNEIDYSAYHIEYVDLPPYVLMEDTSYGSYIRHKLYIPGIKNLNVYAYFQQDQKNQYGTRPSGVEFEYREKNGLYPSIIDCVVVNDDSDTSFNLTQNYSKNELMLPQVSPSGEPLEWEMIILTDSPFYDIRVEADLSPGTSANRNRNHKIYYTLKTEKLRTRVIWDDENDAKNTRPDDVVVTVMTPVLDADGNKVTNEDGSLKLKPVWEGASAVLNESNGWAAEWDLPPCDAAGNELEYYVQQGQLPVHVTTYHDPETDADGVRLLKITNVPLDAWNYAIDLRWETNVAKERYHRYEVDAISNAVRTIKYELTVNTSTVDYNPGMMEVRMPYYLCQKVNGDWVAPTQVSVPMQPEHNEVYSFHYYIDDHGTEDKADDEIVYVNWKEMEAGTNQTLTVIYKITPFEMIDTKVWELTATGYARNEYQEDEQLFEPEVKQSATISYGIDTGAQLEGFYKTGTSYYAGDVQPPDYNGKCLYYYDTTYFDSTLYPKENFDPETYDYVGYYLRVMPIGYTQQYHYHFEEYPEDGGKVVSVKYGSSDYSASGIVNLSEDLTSWDSNARTNHSFHWAAYTSYYVVVAYPRDPDAEDGDLKRYENRAKVTMIADVEHEDDKGPNDYYDLSSMEAYAWTDWEDYEFSYTGNIYSQYKGLEDYFETAGFTLNKFGTDTNVEFYTQTYVYGYNLNGYKYNMTDHDLYLRAQYNDKTYSDFVRISEGDYHLSRLYVYLKAYDYDRSTGEKIANTSVQDKPFKVQGQIGKYGEWVDIGEFVVTEANQNAVMNNNNGKSWSFDIAYKGYTGFRVLTPEGLKGYTYLETNFTVTLHADSPALAPFLEDYDNIQYMWLHNFSTLWLDVLNDEGEYYWFNPIESYQETSNVVLTGLMADDMADYGALPEHDEAKDDEIKVGPSYPNRSKKTLSQTNDTVNGMVRGQFLLQAGVYNSSTQMPTSFYKDMSIDEGVFYDLLPTAWVFDETKPVRAYGSYDSSSYPASVTYEVVDDFRGTGRQLVIFKVKSEKAAGKNYRDRGSQVESYLNVEYTANITWNELRYHRNGVNLMAFQEGDGIRPGREFHVTGSYGTDQYGDDGLPNESYLADYFKLAVGEDGNYAFYDINNDGVTDRNDTLMYYSTVSPEVAMTVETGIYKLVKGDSGLWKKHDTTHTDGTYRYKLGVTTSDGGDTSNLIMYDVLEDATNVEGHSGETGWKGTFVGLDLRLPKSQGIAPVVYYSTTPGLIYANENTDMNIKDESIWSTTPPADLSTVTAIAVDLTTRVDGEPFVFEGQGTTEFEIIMKAPSEVPEVRLAYNRLAYSSDFLTYGNVEAQHKYNIGKRVTIELRDLQDIQFYKMGEMDTVGESETGVAPIGGLRFDLYKCSHVCGEDCAEGCTHTHSTSISSSACWTNTAFRTVYSESDGLVNFVRLDTGSYAVREPSARPGYLTISSVLYVFDVDASNSTVTGPVRIGGSDANDMYAENGTLYLKNFRQTKKIYLYKYWQNEVSGYVYRPEKITVDLYRNGELYMEDLELTAEDKTNSSNTTWRLILEDLMLYDPYGNYYSYTFKEEPVDGYVLYSQSQPTSSSSSTNANLYNRQLGVVEIAKTVVNGDEDKLFTFRMQLDADADGNLPTGDAVAQRWKDGQLVDRTDVTISDTGVIEAQCRHGETLRFVGLPLGYGYTISEVAEDGYTTEVTSGSVTGTITNTSPAAVVFTNTYDASGEWNPVAAKTVNGAVPAEDEVFTFTLTSGADTPDIRQEKSNEGGSITFDAIAYGLEDAGNTYTYTVQETSQSGSGYTVDDTVYTVTVTVVDNGDGTLAAETEISNGSETVEEITFANTYEATGQLPLTAVKTVNGETPREDQVFEFQLIGSNQTVLQTVENNGGAITFETLQYDLDDVAQSPFTYQVKEATADGSGYTVDDTLYTLFVWLADNGDGTLDVTSMIKAGGDTVEAITFNNIYEAVGEFTPVVQKTVNGGTPREDQVYTFNLYSTGLSLAAVNEQVQNNGSTVAFPTLSFTLVDAGRTYTYQVVELERSSGHLVMDETVYTITLQIEDNRDGTLLITPVISNGTETVDEIIFRNMVYAPLTIRKEITGPETEETFPFTIRLYNADGTESTEAFAYTGAKEGILHSGDVILLGQDESITIPYLLPGMSYAVEEEAGIRYTGTVNGQPAEQFAGTCTEGGDQVIFTNVLKTTAIAVVKEWQGGIGGDIQLTLYANGVKVEPQPAYHQDGQTYSYINLPMYDSLGQLITYSVKEKYMDGYLTIYQNVAPHASETDCVYNGGTIINREVITFRIRKVWSGLGDEPAPPIRLTLYCNGVVYDRDQPTPDEDGWYVYRNLLKYVNGERAQYTIKETAMSGYETYYYAIDGSRTEIGYNGGKINNVKLPDTGDRSHPEWWIALAVLAVCAMGGLLIWNRRRR